MSIKKPKVTVLMSVYNGERYLREAVDSILNQTLKNFEFIIINDSSTDRTLKILNGYSDPRIKIINNKENIGLTRSLNKGLSIAKGEYIARQDADDISTPDRLEKELNFLIKRSDYAAVGSLIIVIDKNRKELHTIEKPITDEAIKDSLKKDNCIAHGSSVIRMSCLRDINFYDNAIPKSQDYDLWLRLSEKYKLANIPEYLYFWRYHTGNVSIKNKNEQKHYVEIAKRKTTRKKKTSPKNISHPKFSLLMANYNNSKYIAEAISSVLNQSFKDWELIIVDDASTDDSAEKIRPFLKDKRIRFFKNKVNKGYVCTLNNMVYESRAEIFGILDSDDALTENALREIYNAHIEHPNCGFIYSQFMYCDYSLNPLQVGYCTPTPPEDTNLRRHYACAFRTFKKKDYFKTEGFDKEIVGAEDKDIIYKMEEATNLFFLDKVLYKYRVSPNSQTHEPKKFITAYKSLFLAKIKAFERRLNSDIPNLTIREMSREVFRAIRFFMNKGEFKIVLFFLFRFLNTLRTLKSKKNL